MSDVKTWRYAIHHPPGDGPWKDEPDKAQWVDEASDLDCLAVRAHHGAWCGYVGIPPGHPWYDVSPHKIRASVHGEVNFGSRCDEGKDIESEPAICHVPEPGRPEDVYWIGFDCAHSWDIAPIRDERIRSITGEATDLYDNLLLKYRARYRTLEYVMDEVRSLAAQAAIAARGGQ